MIKKLIAGVFALSFGLVARATTVVTNGTEVTITADAAYTYPERIDSAITKLTVTASTGNPVVTLAACDDSFTGNVSLEGKAYLGFNATTFAGSTATDNATLTLGNGTCIWFNGVIVQPNEIPWKLVVPSGSLAYIRTMTNYDDGSDSAKKANHWRGSVEVAGELRVFGTGSASFYGTGTHSYLWFDGNVSGAGKIATWEQPNATIGHSNGMLAFGNATKEKRIAKFETRFGPTLFFDVGDFRKTDSGEMLIFRNQSPNVHVNMSVVGHSAFTAAGLIKLQKCGGLDIFDGAAVTGAVMVAGTGVSEYSTLYVKNGGSLYWKANPTANAYNYVGYADGTASFNPAKNNLNAPADGFVYMEGAASSIYNEGPLFFGYRSRGYYEQRGGTFTSKPGVRIVLADARARNVPESASHAQMMISGGTFTADQVFLCGTSNGMTQWVDGFADLTVKGTGTVMTVNQITAQVQRETQSGYPTDGTGRGTTGFVNIKSGAVLAAKHIMRDTGGNNWPALFNSKKTYKMSKWYMNFDGGTVKPLEAGEFFASSNGDTTVSWRIPDRATVYAGGAAIDTDGRDVSWSAPLLKPSGKSLDLSFKTFTYPAIDPATGVAPVTGRHGPARVRVRFCPEDDPTDNKYATSASLWATTTATDMRSYGFNGVEVTAPGNDLPDQVLVVADDYLNAASLTNTVATVAAATTGGFTKKGAGTLTLKGANTWGGTTRIEAGALAFTDAAGLPAGTVEIASSALANGVTPLKVVKYTGGEIHIVGATLDDAWFQKQAKILVSDTALTLTPTVKLYGADGAELDTTGWILDRSTDGKVVKFGKVRTEDLTIANADTARGTIDKTGTFAVTNGEVVAVAATPNGHALLGWTVNGEFVAASGLTYDYRTDLAKGTLSLSPVFSTNLYVNASMPNDSGDGMTPATAKKTLAAIMACNVLPGDVVLAAEGDYNEGEVLNSAKGAYIYVASSYADMYSRVKVPDGVTLKASGARERTKIWGRWHASNQRHGPVYGNGKDVFPATTNNALRGVVLGHNSVLDGFTVTNGCATGSSGNLRDDNVGGGIIGFRATDANGASYVRNCTITGSGERNGAVWGCLLENCYLYDNQCSSDGSQCVHSRLVSCIIYNNSNVAFSSHDGIYGSTIIETSGNPTAHIHEFESTFPVVNSIVMFKIDANQSAYTVDNWHNCVVQMERQGKTILSGSCSNIKTNTLAECLLDAKDWYAPKAGSPAIDWGDASLMADVGGLPQADYRGGQRVWNAVVDVGCNEYAQTNEFSAAICGKGAKVSGASEMTELNGEAIDIPNGETLSITWKGRAAGETAKLTVSALTGSLKVYCGGELLQTIGAVGTHTIESVAATTELMLVAEDGTATITSFKPDRPGLILIFR